MRLQQLINSKLSTFQFDLRKPSRWKVKCHQEPRKRSQVAFEDNAEAKKSKVTVLSNKRYDYKHNIPTDSKYITTIMV